MILKIINKCFLIISRNFWIFLNRIRLYSHRIKYGNNCNIASIILKYRIRRCELEALAVEGGENLT